MSEKMSNIVRSRKTMFSLRNGEDASQFQVNSLHSLSEYVTYLNIICFSSH